MAGVGWDVIERHIERIPFSGCWVWMGALQGKGYANTDTFRNTKRGHRVTYELRNGPIPNGLMVLHRCDVRCCVNPDHLFVGTARDNILDAISKGRAVPPRNPHQLREAA